MNMRLWGLLLILCACSTPVWSSELTSAQVDHFASAMRELKPLFDTYSDEVGDDGDATSIIQIARDWAQSLRQYPETLPVLKKYKLDFASMEQLALRVTSAYLALKLGTDGKNALLEQMQQHMDEIETNEDIPADYKQEIKQNIAEMEKNLNASQADQAAVSPFISRLDAIFGWIE